VLKIAVKDVGAAFSPTLERIRNRYTLGNYVATDPEHQPGSYHRPQVRLRKQYGNVNTDYYIAARRGYFTKKP